jgi:signal transduction histidine kinase
MSSKWRDHLRHAFALRLGLWYAALFIVSSVSLSVLTYVLLVRALSAQDHDVLESLLARYTTEYGRSGLAGLARLIDADAGEGRHERLLVRVVSNRAELVYFTSPPGWSDFNLSSLDDPSALRSGWTSMVSDRDGTVLEVGTVELGGGVVVQVGRSSRVRDEVLRNFRARAMQVLALVALIAAAGGGLLTYVGLAPLRALQATLRSILRTGQFAARVDTRGSRDPLDELGRAVNEMLGRIETLVTGMRGALDNVAHDLRTPMTRFRNAAESALISGDPDAMREGLARAVDEADRINATLTALMDISEAETGTMRLRHERFGLSEIVDEAMSLHADDAEDRGVSLASTVDSSIELTADRARLRQVLANLIENAIKYTDPGGRVTIESGVEPAGVTITVRDTGIGIDPAAQPFVWDRLYRADPSRSARGLGLGLSLVRAIVEGHGGHVRVESAPGAGSAFSVTLPTAPIERRFG